MKKRILLISIFALALSLIACSNKKNDKLEDLVSAPETPATLNAPDLEMTVVQNSSATLEVSANTSVTVTVTALPAQGTAVLSGAVVTYQSTNPVFSGQDSFKYKLSNGTVESAEATVRVTVSALPAGTTAMVENYVGSAYSLSGWQAYSSSFGHTVNTNVGFVAGGRNFGIYGDVNSYAGDSVYLANFSVTPVDGAGGAMKDWPWKAELISRAQCGFDATVTMKLRANLGTRPMGAILLNYDISSTQKLNGYQILFNGGGGSLTLSRFKDAQELATAFIDRWPNTNYGTENMANPVERGPYKGWNYQRGNWPAGGNVSPGTNLYLAARYQYDPVSKDTTISYEARSVTGVDMTPGTWDRVVVLTGNDSLSSGGKFGFMALNYHSASQIISTDFDVSEFKLDCYLP